MNLVKNASFLDGATGYVGTGGALSVDETIFGAPGKGVLSLGGTPGNGNTMTISMDYPEGPAVVSGELLEVFVMGKSTIPNLSAKLQVQGGGEVTIPLKAEHKGAATRGVASTFNIYRGRFAAPSTGQARIELSSVAVNGLAQIMLMYRPYIEKVAATARERQWTPGEHYSPDLDLPVWPSSLPPFRADSLQVQPTAVRKAFNGDNSKQSTVRIANRPSYQLKGDMELNSVQLDALEKLCYETSEPFWFVRQDTGELCHAYWAEDGSPIGAGGPNMIRRISIGLVLEVV